MPRRSAPAATRTSPPTIACRRQGSWPAQIHDVKAAIRWTRANAAKLGVDADKIVVAGYSAGGMLSLMAAGTNDKPEFEGDGGTPGVSSKVNASIGVYPLASAQIARGLFPEGQATPENIAAASPTSYISSSFAPTIFIHGTADTTVPLAVEHRLLHQAPSARRADGADGDPGCRACVRQRRARCRRGDGAVDRFVHGSAVHQPEAVSFVRRRRRRRARGGGGPGGGGGPAAAAVALPGGQ